MCKECKRERNKANVAKFLEKKRQQTVTGEPQ